MQYQNEPTDDEVLRIMVDGGKRLCEYAITQWTADKYGLGHEENYRHIARWKKISSRMSDLRRIFWEHVKK